MKRIILSLGLLLAILSAADAQLVLQNGEEGGLYYTLVPVGSDGKSPYLADPGAALAYLKDKAASLDYVPPKGAIQRENNAENALLLGFFVFPDAASLPLAAMLLPGTTGSAAYTVAKDRIRYDERKVPYGLNPLEINYRRDSIQLDNRFLDWLKVPDLVKFSASYDPGLFSREASGKAVTRKTAEALFWKKGGTQIETFKVLAEGDSLYLMLSAFSEMTDGLSYFFYVFNDREAPDALRATVEIPVRKNSGPVFCWGKGETKPRYIGNYVRGTFLLEAKIDFSLLPEEILMKDWRNPTVDLTSCYFEGDHSEEFFLTTFASTDIPRKD